MLTLVNQSVLMSGIVHLFNGLKGFMVVSGQRSGDGFYWRPRLPGTRQYVNHSDFVLKTLQSKIDWGLIGTMHDPCPSHLFLRNSSMNIFDKINMSLLYSCHVDMVSLQQS